MNKQHSNIIYKKEKGIARIIINKPPLNVLNVEIIEEVTTALADADTDQSVFLVVICGAGDRAFSAGVDVGAHLPEKIEKTLDAFHRMFLQMVDLHKPTIAMVNGFALGGGCELAIACDMVIASETAQFGQPEIKVGAIATVATALLPKLVPRKQALELLLTGEIINATEAKSLGLVNKVVPSEQLDTAVNELADKLRENSPVVLQLVKQAIYQGIDTKFKSALDGVTELYLRDLIKTEDAVEGLKAFLEKRKPNWKGK